ncbi:MAG TPA: hypothetical protein ENL39_04780 [Candidatus Aerophobetes bacterium]|uniref:Uncharacterized protein n=1 Tax=Aerophobetes bacterium TaxID=2030807 RepID=A0A7V5I1M6_UNCAE|nr:hypothetical protein [Candidatus Aerophobetes bacterium]
MKVIIDGYEDLVMAEENETLGELLLQLEKWISENKRVIVEVRLEGKPLSESDKRSLFNRRAGEFETLELFTANLWQWAMGSLEEIKSYLPQIAKEIEGVSFFIQQGNYKDAFLLLGKCIGLWDEINEVLMKIENIFALDYTKIFLKENFSWRMEEVVQYLREAKRALRDNDFLALADILEYELAPRIREEKKVVEKIISILKHQMN